MRALRLGGPEAHETAKARLKAALEIDGKLWEAWHDLGVHRVQGRRGRRGDRRVRQGARDQHAATRRPCSRAPRRTAAPARRRTRAPTTRPRCASTDEDDPNRRDAAARLASLLRDFGDFDDAVAVLRDTVRLSGINAKIYTELGLIYIQQKRLELAQLVLAKAIELDAEGSRDLQRARAARAAQGKAQEAFERFDQAARSTRTTSTRGSTRRRCSSTPATTREPRPSSSAIVEKRPDDYAAQVALGVAQRGLKEFDEAKKTWEKVIKEAPRRSTPRADAMFNVAILKLDFTEGRRRRQGDLERYLQEAPRVTPSARPRTRNERSSANEVEARRPPLGAAARVRGGARVCARRTRVRRSRRPRPTRPQDRRRAPRLGTDGDDKDGKKKPRPAKKPKTFDFTAST